MTDASEARTGEPLRADALFVWRLCSGFAHGRTWASLGLLEREVLPSSREGVVLFRQSNTLDRMLYPALIGLDVLQRAIATYELRAQHHVGSV